MRVRVPLPQVPWTRRRPPRPHPVPPRRPDRLHWAPLPCPSQAPASTPVTVVEQCVARPGKGVRKRDSGKFGRERCGTAPHLRVRDSLGSVHLLLWTRQTQRLPAVGFTAGVSFLSSDQREEPTNSRHARRRAARRAGRGEGGRGRGWRPRTGRPSCWSWPRRPSRATTPPSSRPCVGPAPPPAPHDARHPADTGMPARRRRYWRTSWGGSGSRRPSTSTSCARCASLPPAGRARRPRARRGGSPQRLARPGGT